MALNQQKNNKIFTKIRKKMSQIQNDRLNLQKVHQIARIVSPDDRLTKYTIPGMIKWLKTMELMEKMK
ncbi:hypothetical protein NMY3_00236 [Candidatus Nitrosocosmicus oleophilus]|jgi:hypothetical protein|uniref:Uncharacterized protein n=1 Tax=Candidatus Nitrosocosmicus oleophilus TaxID=1353260 RepID=A0A654LUG6_9ARCH|nr:hypothetical protein [Candidatus Nitrosocosmicus oleophilus]ALI34450.1 hypothetical protein NMY3_00236 [Candidatus Nitrosocosmicus oleophilus]